MVYVAKIVIRHYWNTEYRFEFGNNVMIRINGKNRGATALTKRMKKVFCEN